MINIQDIIPFMKKGWVAMDKDGEWYWFEEKPIKSECDGNIWVRKNPCNFECVSRLFDIAPADDWTKSLIKVGGIVINKGYIAQAVYKEA